MKKLRKSQSSPGSLANLPDLEAVNPGGGADSAAHGEDGRQSHSRARSQDKDPGGGLGDWKDVDPAEEGAPAKLPPWVAMGQKLQWFSASQKKLFPVKVSQIDHKQGIVIATFESDPKVWKSVPFKMVGQPSCPLRPYEEQGQGRKRDRSKTPEWWQTKKGKSYQDIVEEQERQAKQKHDQEQKEKDRKAAEKQRQEMIESEKKKVAEVFEKRKQEADALRLRDEEEWRQGLRRKREEEAALEVH